MAYRELFRYELAPRQVDEFQRAANGNFAKSNECFTAQIIIIAVLGKRAVPGKLGHPRKVAESESTDLFLT